MRLEACGSHILRDAPFGRSSGRGMTFHSRDAVRTRVIVTPQDFLALRTDLRQRTSAVDADTLTICALSHDCKKRKQGSGTPRDA